MDGEAKQTRLMLDIESAQIQDISFNEKHVVIAFLVEREGQIQEVGIKKSDKLHPDFLKARNALVDDLMRYCEVPKNAQNPVTITGVSFKYDDGRMGAVIKGTRKFKRSLGVMALNSPVRYKDDKQEQRRLEEDTVQRLEALHAEALLYIGGKVSQMELEFGTGPDGGEVTANGDGQAGEGVPELTTEPTEA